MSERGFWSQTAYSWTIYVNDGAGAAVTGLLNGGFTKQIAKDDANSAVTVTVTEIDSVNLPGWYKVTYTPNANGHWAVRVSHATYNLVGWMDEVQVYTRQLEDLAFPATSGRPVLVSSAGNVGVDWGQVINPTTTVGLSGTTISTSQAVASVTDKANFTLAAGSLTNSVFAANAIGSAQFTAALSNAIADALLDRASALDSKTPRQVLRWVGAACAGMVSGLETGSPTFLGVDGVTTRISATTDSNGNRTAVTLS